VFRFRVGHEDIRSGQKRLPAIARQVAVSPDRALKLSIVAPTLNEAENIPLLVTEIERTLVGTDFEIIISDDDSPDQSWLVAERIAGMNSRVRVLRRTAKKGLGWSVIDGFDAAKGDILACIDADLQHDPAILPRMCEELNKGADLVVGSRYISGGSVGRWGPVRVAESWLASRLAQRFVATKICDPMSGYFLLRRGDFLRVRDRLNGQGFKILLEIAANMPGAIVSEVPYTFRSRIAGKTKLSGRVVFAYIAQLRRLRCKSAEGGTSSEIV